MRHNRTAATRKPTPSPKPAPTAKQRKRLRKAVEEHIQENPIKVVGQAAAAGYAMRFLPLRALVTIGARLALPFLCAAGLWKAMDAMDRRGRLPKKARHS